MCVCVCMYMCACTFACTFVCMSVLYMRLCFCVCVCMYMYACLCIGVSVCPFYVLHIDSYLILTYLNYMTCACPPPPPPYYITQESLKQGALSHAFVCCVHDCMCVCLRNCVCVCLACVLKFANYLSVEFSLVKQFECVCVCVNAHAQL